MLTSCGVNDQGEIGNYRTCIPLPYSPSALKNSPLAVERPPSQESNTSMPDSLFSDPSEISGAGTSTTDTGLASADALAGGGHPKEQNMEDLPVTRCILIIQ